MFVQISICNNLYLSMFGPSRLINYMNNNTSISALYCRPAVVISDVITEVTTFPGVLSVVVSGITTLSVVVSVVISDVATLSGMVTTVDVDGVDTLVIACDVSTST